MLNRLVAFLPGYATDKTRQLDIATIPGDRLTDLIYCFAGFQQQGQTWVVDFPEPNDATTSTRSNLARLVELKTTWSSLNIVVSIGGWIHSHQGDPTFKTTPVFSAIAASAAARQAFVSSCIDLFIKPVHPGIGPLFGGIDIDWEFPSGADTHNFTLLFQEFRTQLDAAGNAQGRHLTLSASSGVSSGELELNQLAPALDWINLMAYLAHYPNRDPQNQVTDFNSPIFAPAGEPASSATWTIDSVVSTFIAAGFPAAKLVLGVNAYGRTYAGVPPINRGVFQPYTGPGPGSYGKPGTLQYKDLMTTYLPKYDSHWDDISKSAWLYSATDRVWISFDSVHSVQAKVLYATQRGLGGLMLWELSADAPSSEIQHSGPRIPALIDAMPNIVPFSIRSLANKAVLQATSSSAPGLAFQSGKPFMAVRKSSRDRLEISLSSDGGQKFGGTYLSPESSAAAPALAAHGTRLMIAWKGSGNDNLNVAEVSLFGDSQGKVGIEGLTSKITLPDTSDHGPALAAHNGLLFLAWKGSGNDNLNVMFSSDNGATFRGKYTSPETSSTAPALASHNGQLMIAWRGSGNDNLNVAEVGLFGTTQGQIGIEGLRNKVTLHDTSGDAPALTSDVGRLFLAWKGSGNDNLNIIFSVDNGASFGGKYTSPESSDAGPVLASFENRIVIAWKGSGNDQLNFAPVAFL